MIAFNLFLEYSLIISIKLTYVAIFLLQKNCTTLISYRKIDTIVNSMETLTLIYVWNCGLFRLHNPYDPYKCSYTIRPLNKSYPPVSVSIFSFYILFLIIFSNTNRKRFNTQGVPVFDLIMPRECTIRHISFQISSDYFNTHHSACKFYMSWLP